MVSHNSRNILWPSQKKGKKKDRSFLFFFYFLFKESFGSFDGIFDAHHSNIQNNIRLSNDILDVFHSNK